MAEATDTLNDRRNADRITHGHLRCVLYLLVFTYATTSNADDAAQQLIAAQQWMAPIDSNAIHINRVETGNASIVHRFRIQNNGDLSPLVFKSPCRPSKLHNDFEASIQVIASIAGLRPGLIILLPQQSDPRTGRPLQTIIRGDLLREIDVEKKLEVKVTKQAVDSQLRTLRAELHQPDINAQEAIVIGLAIVLEAIPGEQFIEIGKSEYGPVVDPGETMIGMAGDAFGSTRPTTPESRHFIPIDISLDSIQVNRKPAILRLAPDHGESTETLQQLRLNAVWVNDFRQTERARELYDLEFAVLVTPPHPEFEPGGFSKLLEALPPLEQLCPSGSGWILGTRVSRDDLAHLLAWSREVRSGDRKFQRPQLADLTEAEGAAAREIDLIGIGRHVVGRSESFGELRNLLFRRRRSGGNLAFPWTWVQIEPSSAQQVWRGAMRLEQSHIEPEQIQHQVYAAISAGCKGIGFWKTRALDPENPRDQETAIAIELACLEIELLEPFLARGRLDGHLSLKTASEQQAVASAFDRKRLSAIQSAFSSGNISTSAGNLDAPLGPDAAVITSHRAMLILPTMWDDTAQIVPGPMYERSIELTVAATETASAYQISTTAIRYIPREVAAGGLHVQIDNFDRSTAILVSSDQGMISNLRERIFSMAERAATQTTKLANLKYVRVLQVLENLRDEHSVPRGADALISSAKQQLDHAEHELATRDFDEAAMRSRDCLRILRQVQHACWNDAVAELDAPAQSPHALSFSTLPEHWRLVHYVDRQSHRISENLLPSGDFESVRRFSEDGWQRDAQDSLFHSTADLVAESTTGNAILQMKAWQSRPGLTPEITPLSLTTPAIRVESGDVMLVRGRLRKGRSTGAISAHPILIFDSELGPECGLRPKLNYEWQTFEMLRPISVASEFRVSFALTGQAEIQLDDLVIQKLPPIPSRQILRLTGDEVDSP